MKDLINVLYYLQQNDLNGNYIDILDEIDDEKITITEAKKECISILKNWQIENLSSTDIMSYNRMENLINSIK